MQWVPAGGYLSVEEISSVDEARALKGASMALPRPWIEAHFPEVFFPEWLAGRPVVINHTHAGTVEAVTELPSQWLLQVRIGEERYEVPFIPSEGADLRKEPLELSLPEGWQLK